MRTDRGIEGPDPGEGGIFTQFHAVLEELDLDHDAVGVGHGGGEGQGTLGVGVAGRQADGNRRGGVGSADGAYAGQSHAVGEEHNVHLNRVGSDWDAIVVDDVRLEVVVVAQEHQVVLRICGILERD